MFGSWMKRLVNLGSGDGIATGGLTMLCLTWAGCSSTASTKGSRLLRAGQQTFNNGVPTEAWLSSLAKRYLKLELSKEEQASDWSAPTLTTSQLTYAAKDVEVLLKLEPKLSGMLATAGLDPAFSLECKALPAMAQMWRTGLPWNRTMLENLRKDYEHDIAQLGKDFLLELDAALPEEHKLPRDLPQRLVYLKDKVTQMGHDDSDYEKWYAEIEELETQPTVFNLRAKDEGKIRDGTKNMPASI